MVRRRPERLASEPPSRGRGVVERWEPGFLRLAGGLAGVAPLSFIVDGRGVYFDATTPSQLEGMLQEGGWETAELMSRADAAGRRLRTHRISLDNGPGRVAAPPRTAGRRRVVVVDQARDDPAVGFGLAGADRFAAMLAEARRRDPDADILVAHDPASNRSASSGHLMSARSAQGVRLLTEPVEAWSLIEGCDRLYTVSAHVGFEAATAGVPVTCFGAPFYAGWGFTDDRLALPRRTRQRTVTEVFAAAHLVCSRHFDPFTGDPIALEEALSILELCVSRGRENAASTLCTGFASWKRPWVVAALGAPGFRPELSSRARIAPEDVRGRGRVVSWASRAPEGVEEACRAEGVPHLRMEDGFIRSIGLGVGLRPGASYVLDRAGIYYDATAPSDLETLLQTTGFDPPLLARAAALRESVVAAGLSKYNVGAAAPPPLPGGGPVVLVAGQVENDASIRLGRVTVEGNAGLLRAARAAHPGAVIAYKPHPDVEAGLRPGRIHARKLETLCDVVLRDVAAPDAIAAADHVEVATSLLGFEALLRGKPVTTRGLPFYAGWGLTDDPGCPRRTRRLTLDELVAGALILYPRYIDPVTGLPCAPEVLVRRLAERRPGLGRPERTFESFGKALWSAAFRRAAAR